jgi:hypothetical protein
MLKENGGESGKKGTLFRDLVGTLDESKVETAPASHQFVHSASGHGLHVRVVSGNAWL